MVEIIQYLMILFFIPFIYLVSWGTKQLLLRPNLGPFRPFITVFRFIGVLIHELCHAFMCILVGIRPKGFQVRLRSYVTGRTAPSGQVDFDSHNMTFLQAALIALAPIIIGSWLFFLGLRLMFAGVYDVLIIILAFLLCFSLLLGGAPSRQDIGVMCDWFKKDPKYSLYQIFLVVLSIITVWVFLSFYNLVLPLDVLFFILAGICYYPLKYTFLGLSILIHSIMFRGASGMKYNEYTRKRFKPAKPHKIGRR